jgi:hypothetical protein
MFAACMYSVALVRSTIAVIVVRAVPAREDIYSSRQCCLFDGRCYEASIIRTTDEDEKEQQHPKSKDEWFRP